LNSNVVPLTPAQRVRAGTDLLKRGLARTALLGAMVRGLRAAGITYTLPPVRNTGSGKDGPGGGDADAFAAFRSAAADGDGGVETAGTLAAAKEDQAGMAKAAAAANNMLLLA
jgi:hypothetical protein